MVTSLGLYLFLLSNSGQSGLCSRFFVLVPVFFYCRRFNAPSGHGSFQCEIISSAYSWALILWCAHWICSNVWCSNLRSFAWWSRQTISFNRNWSWTLVIAESYLIQPQKLLMRVNSFVSMKIQALNLYCHIWHIISWLHPFNLARKAWKLIFLVFLELDGPMNSRKVPFS